MRDQTGKFIKQSHSFTITLPSVYSILIFILSLLILSPWFLIVYRNDFVGKIALGFEKILLNQINNTITNGANGAKEDKGF